MLLDCIGLYKVLLVGRGVEIFCLIQNNYKYHHMTLDFDSKNKKKKDRILL